MKLNRAIPQSFATMGGKVQVTVRYRDQPMTCFQCGSHDQERKDCIQQRTYAQAVEEDIPPKVDPPCHPSKWLYTDWVGWRGVYPKKGEERKKEEGKKIWIYRNTRNKTENGIVRWRKPVQRQALDAGMSDII